MEISMSTIKDIPLIMDLVELCIKDLENQGIYQWNDYYPTLDHITKSIQIKSLYILKNKNCIGIISINEIQPEGYEKINWLDKTGNVLVISKLAVKPECQQQGIGRKLMDFAENYALKNNYNSIRLDAYSDNLRALNFYERRDYRKVGQHYFPMRELPFYLYEKLLSP